MVWQANPYSLPLLGAAVMIIIVATLAWRRRPALGAATLALLSAAVAVWALTYAWYWAAPDSAQQGLALSAGALGADLVPVVLLFFVLEVTGRRRWLTRRRVIVFVAIYAAILLFEWTDSLHHLWYFQVSAVTQNGLRALDVVPNWGYWIFSDGYGYLLVAVAWGLLAREWWQARGIYRMQYGLILAAISVPLAASLLSELNLTPWPDLDLTPLAMAGAAPLIAYALFRFRLLDLVPIARSVLVDRMTDAIVVLDQQHRVLDVNTATLKLTGWAGAPPLGQPAQVLFAVWPDLMARYAEVFDASVDITPGPDLTLELLITPLRDPQGELSGRLIVLRDVTRQRLTERELHDANNQLRAQLVEINHLQDRLRQQALHDALTGLFNRRHLEESLVVELARAARERQPVSVVFIDIDHFKLVNDTYGHGAGDRVLQSLAHYLVLNSRASDLVCRYGGEEFVVILSGAEAEAAALRAEQWRQGLSELAVTADDRLIHLTISAGLAVFPADGVSLDEILRAADAALYQAKADGRNCVRRAQPAAARLPAYGPYPVPALVGQRRP